jgi:V8-like Glu-specific endopeptidase
MKKPLRAAAISIVGGAVLVIPGLAPAAEADQLSAINAPTASPDQVLRFWTPERMRHATPMDTLVRAHRSRSSLRAVRAGLPSVTSATLPQVGAAWTDGGKVTHTVGRVFFTFQGATASCSGDAVTSANASTVITAGHCVRLDGSWHKNWVFVPGYHDGKAPFGKWTARRTLTTPQWKADEDLNFDVGAAVVNPLHGRRLTSVVGGQGIAFNQKRGQDMTSFGYPAETPYDGSKLIFCSGTTIDDPLTSNDQGMACDMTGGSSGGPWFLRFADGRGVQNSVNSFKYTFLPTHMFGPYFGTAAQNLYRQAEHT